MLRSLKKKKEGKGRNLPVHTSLLQLSLRPDRAPEKGNIKLWQPGLRRPSHCQNSLSAFTSFTAFFSVTLQKRSELRQSGARPRDRNTFTP